MLSFVTLVLVVIIECCVFVNRSILMNASDDVTSLCIYTIIIDERTTHLPMSYECVCVCVFCGHSNEQFYRKLVCPIRWWQIMVLVLNNLAQNMLSMHANVCTHCLSVTSWFNQNDDDKLFVFGSRKTSFDISHCNRMWQRNIIRRDNVSCERTHRHNCQCHSITHAIITFEIAQSGVIPLASLDSCPRE